MRQNSRHRTCPRIHLEQVFHAVAGVAGIEKKGRSLPLASTGSQSTTTGISALAIAAELAAKKSPAASVTKRKKRSIEKRRKKSPRILSLISRYITVISRPATTNLTPSAIYFPDQQH